MNDSSFLTEFVSAFYYEFFLENNQRKIFLNQKIKNSVAVKLLPAISEVYKYLKSSK